MAKKKVEMLLPVEQEVLAMKIIGIMALGMSMTVTNRSVSNALDLMQKGLDKLKEELKNAQAHDETV